MEGWQPAAAPGLRLAARRARVGESEPQCAQPLDGALLRRHGDARRHDALGRPRHDAAARALRRARPRAAGAARAHAVARAALAAGLPAARHAGSSPPSTSTSGKLCAGLQIHVDDAGLRPRRLSPLAAGGARLQGAARPRARLRAVARLSVRVRAQRLADRPHQRRRAAARMGGRPVRHAGGPRSRCAARTRARGSPSASRSCSTADQRGFLGRAARTACARRSSSPVQAGNTMSTALRKMGVGGSASPSSQR